MKVQGVGNNAEFGQVGDISTTSRGGTNDFHGALFEYLQNRAFDATAFGSTTKPQKTANDFGGNLGGRLIRNHTFFFVAFEDIDRKSTRLNSSHLGISYAVFCLKKKKNTTKKRSKKLPPQVDGEGGRTLHRD